MNDIITTTLIGAIVTITGSFFAYLISKRKEDRKDKVARDKKNQDMMNMLIDVVKENSLANKRVAEATERAADEAKERNGHLAEITMEARKQSEKLFDRNLRSYKKSQDALAKVVCKQMQEVKKQHVQRQEVDKQIIK